MKTVNKEPENIVNDTTINNAVEPEEVPSSEELKAQHAMAMVFINLYDLETIILSSLLTLAKLNNPEEFLSVATAIVKSIDESITADTIRQYQNGETPALGKPICEQFFTANCKETLN